MIQFSRVKLVLPITSVVLGVAALAYWERGFSTLLTHPIDLNYHWVWEKYIFNKQYPPDVVRAHGELYGTPSYPSGRNDALIPSLEIVQPSPYPPWTFFTEFLWMLPSWMATRIWFATWNLAALGLLVCWSFRLRIVSGDSAQRWLMAASVAAISGICTTLRNGQFGIVVAAFVLGAMLLEEHNKHAAAGLLLGAAMLKPTLAIPFIIPFLVRRRLSTLVTFGAYLAVGTVAIWSMTGAGPLAMWRDMQYAWHLAGMGGYGPVDMLKSAGVPAGLANGLPAAIGAAAALGISLSRWRLPMLPLFGVLSAVARLWAYHKHYDNIILVFLLVALADTALKRKDYLSKAIFLMVGLSLWLPATATEFALFRGFQMIAWIVGPIVLFIETKTPGQRVVRPTAGRTTLPVGTNRAP